MRASRSTPLFPRGMESRHTTATVDPTGPNSSALKRDPLIWNNDEATLRLGKERETMNPQQASALMGKLQQQAAPITIALWRHKACAECIPLQSQR